MIIGGMFAAMIVGGLATALILPALTDQLEGGTATRAPRS